MAEFDRHHGQFRGWSPQRALNVLASDSMDFAHEEGKLRNEAAMDRQNYEGPLARAIENGDVPVMQLFDSLHPHKPNQTVESETHFSDKSGIKKDGKLTLRYDSQGLPAAAEFHDNFGNVENVTLDPQNHTAMVQDRYQMSFGTTATFDFDQTQLITHQKVEMPTSTEQYDFERGSLSHHIFSINGATLEFRDDQIERTITATGPKMGRNPIVKEKYDYGVIDTTPRTIQFTANGKDYRGVQLSDGRWKLGELK
jgi:hypothetical protein